MSAPALAVSRQSRAHSPTKKSIAHALDCRVIDLIGDLDDASIPSPLFRQDTAHLREAGAPDLLAAYAAAPPTLRKAVLKLVQEIAKDHRARTSDGEAEAEPRKRVGKR